MIKVLFALLSIPFTVYFPCDVSVYIVNFHSNGELDLHFLKHSTLIYDTSIQLYNDESLSNFFL